MKDYVSQSVARIETTIGELVATLTDVAQDVIAENPSSQSKEGEDSDWRSYELAAETLGQILHKNEIEVDLSA